MTAPQKLIIGDSRRMSELADGSVHLVVTSPPYWQLKDYGRRGQIGWRQDLASYHDGLEAVWRESYRALHDGCRLCVNIGDQFARKEIYGRYKVVPLHAEIICRAEAVGFDFMGSVIWQKVTTCNSSGGGALMGSYPFPRNGVVKLDYEHILLFKKPGVGPRPEPEAKEASRIELDEWKSWFDGHWQFPGARAHAHLAPFPTELPRRLIRMFTFRGERVVDPFVGSGTTLAAAAELGREGIGYDLDIDVVDVVTSRLRGEEGALPFEDAVDLDVIVRETAPVEEKPEGEPFFGSVVRKDDRGRQRHEGARERLQTVTGANTFTTRSGREITLLGTEAIEGTREQAVARLDALIRGKTLVLTGGAKEPLPDGETSAYVHLSDRTFVNSRMIREGLLRADAAVEHVHRRKFMREDSAS